MSAERKFRIGFVMNPVAGIGGPVALKGSDGAAIVARAIALGSESKVAARCSICLQSILTHMPQVTLFTVGGPMGGALCDLVGIDSIVLMSARGSETRASDTRDAVAAFQEAGVDLILFAGGDGTARDVCDSINPGQLVLGIPCGVKMHSGVFANSPADAGKILADLVTGTLVSVMKGEVRDIDESSFREGRVKTAFHGEMWVPAELRYVQQVKSGGREVEGLVLPEIAAHITEQLQPGVTYFVGSGSTTLAITDALGIAGTLLGVDVVRDGHPIRLDATESELFAFANQGPCHIIATFIAGQGHIFGRGNQQLSARVIRAVGFQNLTVAGTKTKLEALGGAPLRVDTGDLQMDRQLSGPIRVVTGYEDIVLYPVVG